MHRWVITSIKDLSDVLVILNQYFEGSNYRFFRVDVELTKNDDVGVYVQNIARYSFDISDTEEALELIDNQVLNGLKWSYDVAVYFIECGPEVTMSSDGVGAPAGAP